MKYETWDTGGTASTLLSTTYYYYNDLGNVTRVVTNAAGSDVYEATRFGYAKNQATVSFVVGETWSSSTYEITYARQFRYDGARQRYLNRELDPVELQTYGTLGEVGSTWSDYDGDAIYGDRELIGGNLENTASYEPGLGKSLWADDGTGTWVPEPPSDTSYDRSDLIGTTRHLTDGTGDVDPVVYTAFGERVDGFHHRYGYAGAWGYQSHSFGEVSPPLDPDTVFPYLHVGARYYDPATGRFLQRDPIGIRGAINGYEYVLSNPVSAIDPQGLSAKHGNRGGHIYGPPGPWCPGCQRETYDLVRRIPDEARAGLRKIAFWLGCAAVVVKSTIDHLGRGHGGGSSGGPASASAGPAPSPPPPLRPPVSSEGSTSCIAGCHAG